MKAFEPLQKRLDFSTFIIGLVLFAAIVCNGIVWGRNFNFQVVGFGISFILLVLYFVWRTRKGERYLVRIGIEGVLGVAVFAILLSWFFSPNMRIGLERVGAFLGFIYLLYVFIDGLDAGFNRWSIILALLIFSGVYVLSGVAETLLAYRGWFENTGFIMPPYIYRFTSFMGHANGLMGLANLVAPLALAVFLHRKPRIEKIGAGVWLVFYFLAVPFSSSRGGWLGMAAWMGVVFGLFLLESGIFHKVWRWLRVEKKRLLIFILGSVLIFVVLAAFGLLFLQVFASHPSHGTNIFGGRGVIWGNVLKIWQKSPWVGVGPGRVGLEYPLAAGDVPPQFWALSGHGLFTQVLAEFGVLGLVGLVVLLAGWAAVFVRIYRHTPTEMRVWSGAIMGGCAAWLAHGMFEEMLYAPILVPMILLVAWMMTAQEKPVERWTQVDLRILWVPGMILLFTAGRNLWCYQPMASALNHLDWSTTRKAQAVDLSLKRDPKNYFYASQAGMAWAEAWQETGDREALQTAIARLRFARNIEPGFAPDTANLALLEWEYDEKVLAVQNMIRAGEMTPKEGTFVLNAAVMYEEEGNTDEAIRYYQEALRRQPEWASHPFWRTTETRTQAVSSWINDSKEANPSQSYWRMALQEIDRGNLAQAQVNLSYAAWVGEPIDAIVYVLGRLAEEGGEIERAVNVYEMIRQRIRTERRIYYYMAVHSLQGIFLRQGFGVDLVAGFIRLYADEGQMEVLNRLGGLYQASGNETQLLVLQDEVEKWMNGQ